MDRFASLRNIFDAWASKIFKKPRRNGRARGRQPEAERGTAASSSIPPAGSSPSDFGASSKLSSAPARTPSPADSGFARTVPPSPSETLMERAPPTLLREVASDADLSDLLFVFQPRPMSGAGAGLQDLKNAFQLEMQRAPKKVAFDSVSLSSVHEAIAGFDAEPDLDVPVPRGAMRRDNVPSDSTLGDNDEAEIGSLDEPAPLPSPTKAPAASNGPAVKKGPTRFVSMLDLRDPGRQLAPTFSTVLSYDESVDVGKMIQWTLRK